MNKKNRYNLCKYFVSEGISLLGSSIVSLAIIWYVTLETDSSIAVAGITITTYLPQLLTLFIGGIIADRQPSKRIIIISDLSIALSTSVLAILFACGRDNMWWIFFFNSLRALGTGIQLPAVRSMLPKLVLDDKIMQANSISTGIWSVIQLISPAIGGLIMSVYAMQYVLLLDVITAVFGVIVLSRVKVAEKIEDKLIKKRENRLIEKTEDKPLNNKDRGFGEGLRYIKRKNVLVKCVIFYFLFQFLVMPASQLVPILVTRKIGEDIWLLSMIETMFSVGALLISIFMAVKEIKIHHFKLLGISSVIFGITMIMLLTANTALAILICMLVMGIGSPLYFTPLMTHIQEHTDEEHMGRVFAIVDIVSTIAIPLGMMLFGPIANYSIHMSFIIPGCMLVILGIYNYLLAFRSGI